MHSFVPHGTDAARALAPNLNGVYHATKRCRSHRPRIQPYSLAENNSQHSSAPLGSFTKSKLPATTPSRNLGPDASAHSPFQWDISDYPPFIPQTMECALKAAQDAALHALSDGLRRIIVELPMGRIRKYRYQLAPQQHWLRESGLLASHFVEALRSADVRVVVSECCDPSSCTQKWITCKQPLRSADCETLLKQVGESTIVVLVGVPGRHVSYLERICGKVPDTVPVVLFNCLMDMPMNSSAFKAVPTFEPTYMCRSLKRSVFSRFGHRQPWHLFLEIAVFEYDWIANVPNSEDESYVPTLESIERVAEIRGAVRKGNSTYYQQIQPGCEAGFWPFMSLAANYILPLDGSTYLEDIDPGWQKRKAAKPSRPFGFF